MVVNFAIADAADIPDRLRFRGWFASAVRFTQQVINRVKAFVTTQLQPNFESPDPKKDLRELTNSSDFALEDTTALKPINLDWYQFFTVSPPLTQRGN
ncbi:hypothetical protein IQ265_20070 [Nodosilinea sp. LEGE 06152]|uniref:hypothetical protein n=1 Tax=Nodosilinea sp. LEGE 06152 TaxID=2777966 RepID=UPI00187F33F6|nr:hypothetical protein [Nodosilinea sp. LEGE 06152]MBE9159114.1 hypothetical protein [Nodosilinea sp. LEGE 06152]